MAQLETLRDVGLLRRVLRYAELRGLLTEYRKTGEEPARTAANDLFFIENSYKALYGELQALLDPELLKRKRAEEGELRKYVVSSELNSRVAGAWDAIAKAQAVYRDIEIEYYVKESRRGFSSKYFSYARTLVRGAEERAKPNTERLPEFAETKLPELERGLFSTAPVYADFEKLKFSWALTKMREWLGADDPFVKQVLGKESPEQLATRMVGATKLGDPAVRKALWSGGSGRSLNPPIRSFNWLWRSIRPRGRSAIALRTKWNPSSRKTAS